jgi:LPXTG-motif cell wall-anchored protein
MSYGTSMAVGGQHGLGEGTSAIDWTSIIQGGLQTGIDIYTSGRQEKQLEQERKYQLELAKLTQGRSLNQAGDSSGDTTQRGMFGSKNTIYVVGGVVAVAALGFMFLGKKKRR